MAKIRKSKAEKEISSRFFTERDGVRYYKLATNHGVFEVPESQVPAAELSEHEAVVRLLAMHEQMASIEAEYRRLNEEFFPGTGSYYTTDRRWYVQVKSSTKVEIKEKGRISDHLKAYLDRKTGAAVSGEEQLVYNLVRDLITGALHAGSAMDSFLRVNLTPENSDPDLAEAQRLLRESQVAKPAVRYVNIYELKPDGKGYECVRKNV